MSFIAGIAQRGAIDPDTRRRFDETLHVFEQGLTWPLERIDAEDHILAKAAPTDMWEGPKAMAGSEYDAIGIGTQWKPLPIDCPTLEYLASKLLKNSAMENHFDYFACVVYDKARGHDPVAYHVHKDVLVFSSHQYFMWRYLRSVSVCWSAVFEFLLLRRMLARSTQQVLLRGRHI